MLAELLLLQESKRLSSALFSHGQESSCTVLALCYLGYLNRLVAPIGSLSRHRLNMSHCNVCPCDELADSFHLGAL